jgi:hypothetical protein
MVPITIPGRVRRSQCAGRFALRPLGHLCQAEISQLAVAVPGHQNVGRLDVAMQNAGCVRGSQSVGHANQQVDDLPPGTLLTRPIAQRASIYELGDQVLAALELAGIVNGQYVRMVQRRRHLRFALESAPGSGVRQIAGKDLHRDKPVELGIESTVHLAHATLAEKSLDAVCAEPCAGRERTRLFQTGKRSQILRQKRLHLAPQFLIALASFGQKRFPRARLKFAGRVVQLFDLPDALRAHDTIVYSARPDPLQIGLAIWSGPLISARDRLTQKTADAIVRPSGMSTPRTIVIAGDHIITGTGGRPGRSHVVPEATPPPKALSVGQEPDALAVAVHLDRRHIGTQHEERGEGHGDKSGRGVFVYARSSARIGNFRIRFLVRAKIAFATAGAVVGVLASPIPPGALVLGTMCTCTTGISSMRSTSY